MGLADFVDFWMATRPKLVSDPKKLVSQANQYRTYLFPLMLKGLAEKKLFQGGQKMVDFVQLQYTNSGQFVNPQDNFQFQGTNSLTSLEANWSIFTCHAAMNEFEIDFQSGNELDTYKRVRDAKEAEMELSWWESQEQALFGAPNYELMEASTLGAGQKRRPLTIHCYVTRDGLMPTSTNSTLASGSSDFTSLLGASSATYTAWRNQVASYDNSSQTTREHLTASTGFLAALDKSWLRVQWKPPETTRQWVSETNTNKLRLIGNESTCLMVQRIARASNNVLTPKNDVGWVAGPGVTYHGIPIQYIAILDGQDTGDYEFQLRLLNFNHFKPIFHTKHYRRLQQFKATAAQPFDQVAIEDTAQGLWCANRREQAIVTPSDT